MAVLSATACASYLSSYKHAGAEMLAERMSVLWDKVWFDFWQHKARTLLAVLSIAAGVFAIGTIFGLVDQLLSTHGCFPSEPSSLPI